MTDDGADFMVVEPALDRRHQGDRKSQLRAAPQGRLLLRAQVAAPQPEVRLLLEPVELEVDHRLELREVVPEAAGPRPAGPIGGPGGAAYSPRLRRRAARTERPGDG